MPFHLFGVRGATEVILVIHLLITHIPSYLPWLQPIIHENSGETDRTRRGNVKTTVLLYLRRKDFDAEEGEDGTEL